MGWINADAKTIEDSDVLAIQPASCVEMDFVGEIPAKYISYQPELYREEKMWREKNCRKVIEKYAGQLFNDDEKRTVNTNMFEMKHKRQRIKRENLIPLTDFCEEALERKNALAAPLQ